MTPGEAIEILGDFGKQAKAKADGAYQTNVGKMACDMAISALKEIQQYREIGTVEEIKSVKKYIDLKRRCGTPTNTIDLCAEYITIGTVEECREAVEKQKAKKPLGGADINGNEYMICRECSAIVEDGEWRAMYCPDCGQAIQWDENLEE